MVRRRPSIASVAPTYLSTYYLLNTGHCLCRRRRRPRLSLGCRSRIVYKARVEAVRRRIVRSSTVRHAPVTTYLLRKDNKSQQTDERCTPQQQQHCYWPRCPRSPTRHSSGPAASSCVSIVPQNGDCYCPTLIPYSTATRAAVKRNLRKKEL